LLSEVVVFVPMLVALAVFGCAAEWSAVSHDVPRPGDGPGNVVSFWFYLLLLTVFVVMMAGMAVRWLVPALTHQVALRIDHDGVTLGPEPVLPARAVMVAWKDIEAVVVVHTGVTVGFFFPDRRRHIGLRLRPDAVRPRGVPTPGTLRARLRRLNAYNRDWHGEVFRMVRGWRLDDARLRSAVHVHSRDVEVEYHRV
jgi:hypothetical protein